VPRPGDAPRRGGARAQYLALALCVLGPAALVLGAARMGVLWPAQHQLRGAGVRQVNPVEAGLAAGLVRYRATWGALPKVAVGPGAVWRTAPAHQIGSLRQRLGMSPLPSVYDGALEGRLRAFQHVHGLDESGLADAATVAALNRDPAEFAARIQANLVRARGLPAVLGARHVWVDVPMQRVELVEHGRARWWMRAVVGKPATPTPEMNGRIGYLAINPYWNLPPDLIAERARRVLREGVGVLARERIEVLSG